MLRITTYIYERGAGDFHIWERALVILATRPCLVAAPSAAGGTQWALAEPTDPEVPEAEEAIPSPPP